MLGCIIVNVIQIYIIWGDSLLIRSGSINIVSRLMIRELHIYILHLDVIVRGIYLIRRLPLLIDSKRMRHLEICHLFDNLILFNTLVAVHFWVVSTIFIIAVDDLVVNVLDIRPVSSLLLGVALVKHARRIVVEALDIIWNLKVSWALSI
jgi:hypothetical protein